MEVIDESELGDVLPSKKITIRLITWNIGFRSLAKSIDLSDLCLKSKITGLFPDLIVVNLQEHLIDQKDVLINLQATFGPKYLLYTTYCFGALSISIFTRRDLIWFFSQPISEKIILNPSIKTKGAIVLGFTIFGSVFFIINNHLSAHEDRINKRVRQISIIEKELVAFSKKKFHSKPDFVFWSGDFNSRSMENRECVNEILELNSYEKICSQLLKRDELSSVMGDLNLLQYFSEGKINFLPTYKFDRNSNEYDTSEKNRVPSYTDRIFFSCTGKESVLCLDYNSCDNYQLSDHKPLYAVLVAELKPLDMKLPREKLQPSYGEFNREIYEEGFKKRIMDKL